MTEALLEREPAAAVVEAKPDQQHLDLRKLDLEAVALAQFGDWAKASTEAKKHLDSLALDMTTQAGVDAAISERQKHIKAPLAEARRVEKALKSKLTSVSKAVGLLLPKVEAAWESASKDFTARIDAAQEKLDAERAEQQRVEAERVKARQDGIAAIRAWADHAIGLPAERIAVGIEKLAAMTFPAEQWQEFAVPAANAACETVEKLRTLHAQAVKTERLRAERDALETARIERMDAAFTRATNRVPADRVFTLRDRFIARDPERKRVLPEHTEEYIAALEALQVQDQRSGDAPAHATSEPSPRPAAEPLHQHSQQLAPTGEGKAVTPGSSEPEAAPDTTTPIRGGYYFGGSQRAMEERAEVALHEESEAAAHRAVEIAEGRPSTATAAPDDAPLETVEGDAVVPTAAVVEQALQGTAAVVLTSPIELMRQLQEARALLRACDALAAYVEVPLNSKFPSQPKTTREWWAGLRTLVEDLRPRLEAAL